MAEYAEQRVAARPLSHEDHTSGLHRGLRRVALLFAGVGSIIGSGWLAAASVAPIEMQAAIRYASNYIGGLTHVRAGTPVLTFPLGYAVEPEQREPRAAPELSP